MDGAAEPPGMGLRRVLARVTRPLAHGTTKAPLYAANHHPTKNPAEAGLSA